jgi:hypothetical protein
MRWLAIGAALAALAGAGTSLGATQAAFHPVLKATLTGAAAVPKGAPNASGTARITLNRKSSLVCWSITAKGLGKTYSAHIHVGTRGKTGSAVIPLGARYAAKGCVRVPAKTLLAVGRKPGAYYVDVHTHRYVNGAIRGQLATA